MASALDSTLNKLTEVDGFIAGALIDADSGMSLGSVGGGDDFDIEVAGATNTDVVKAKLRAVEALGLDDHIEDILITLGNQYHLVRPLEDRPQIFFYLALNRSKANLAMARLSVADASKGLDL